MRNYITFRFGWGSMTNLAPGVQKAAEIIKRDAELLSELSPGEGHVYVCDDGAVVVSKDEAGELHAEVYQSIKRLRVKLGL